MTIGDRIKAIREKLGLTQKEFAKRIDSSQAAIQVYEYGKSVPNSPVLERICNTYNVNPQWLLLGNGEPFNSIDNKTIAGRLRYLRDYKGLKQKEVAKKLGIPPTTYRGYEIGISLPNFAVLAKVVEVFNVNAEWLLTGKGSVFKGDKEGLKEDYVEVKKSDNGIDINISIRVDR